MRDIFIGLNLSDANPAPISLKQGDATKLYLRVTSDGRNPYSLIGAAVTLNIGLTDGSVITQINEIAVADSMAVITLDSRAVESAGTVRFELFVVAADGRVSSYIFDGAVATGLSDGGSGDGSGDGSGGGSGGAPLTVNAQTVTISTDTWTDGSATVEAEGVTADSVVIVCPQSGGAELFTACGIRCTAQADGELTFVCDKLPNGSIDIEVIII